MMIEDGTGSGSKAKVNGENQVEVLSITVPYIRHINVLHNRVWVFALDAAAPSGATWFMVFFNSGQKTYTFSRLVLVSSVAGVFRLSKVTGTPVGGTTLPPASLNLGSTGLLDNCLAQMGASITGLTESNLIAPIYCPAGQPVSVETDPGIVVPPGVAGLALKAPASATVNGFIEVYEEALIDDT